jgi:hypothetical protein
MLEPVPFRDVELIIGQTLVACVAFSREIAILEHVAPESVRPFNTLLFT